jgi:hypothetical protein
MPSAVAGESSYTIAALQCLFMWSTTCDSVSVGEAPPALLRLALLCATAVPAQVLRVQCFLSSDTVHIVMHS